MGREKDRKLCKVVYFDEDSVTDYVQIVSGGELEKTAELLKESNKGIDVGATAKASFGTVMAALLGLKVSAETTVDTEISFSANKMVKNIVKNTILTDFLEIVRKDSSNISSFYFWAGIVCLCIECTLGIYVAWRMYKHILSQYG